MPEKKKSGLPIVSGKPYDEDEDWTDSLARGIDEGIRRRREEAAAEEQKKKESSAT